MEKKSSPGRRPAKPTEVSPPKSSAPSASPASTGFPIVGIGASAGGLEALGEFLGHVPADSGMAFVVVTHLDPTRKGIMPELLQRVTKMKVILIKDRTKIQPDCVYVIPPNKDLSLLHGTLHLLAPTAPRGLRLPIDSFFRSLAQDQHERSIGVILSGMGSDGTLGLQAIKEMAGVVMVQTAAAAKFDGMPRSAIDTGLADIVAPADELPGKLLTYLQRAPMAVDSEVALENMAQSTLEKAVILLRAHTGHDFSHYKKNTLHRRIERRMGIHQISKTADYIRYLQENSQELDLLFKELLIGVTNFFRDPAIWEYLRDQAIPELLASRPPGQALRAWVTGCATGEEAYSLAMVFKEAVEAITPKADFSLHIFATDLDKDAISKARQCVFPADISADVSPARLARFFAKDDHGYRVRKEIRDMVTFAPQNLIMDAPFTKLDILTCRNLLIYLDADLQKKLMPLFHHNLNLGGILLLGSAETVGGFTDLFDLINPKSRLYRRTESALRPGMVEFPSSFSARASGGRTAETHSTTKPPASLQSAADQLVLTRYAPPAALCNDKGDIFYISGHTGKYLEPAAGKANWNIFAMAREGLRYDLNVAFQKALRQKSLVTFRGHEIRPGGGELFVEVTVQQLEEAGPLQGLVMIVFTDLPAPVGPKSAKGTGRTAKTSAHAPRLAELERELQAAREETRTAREDMQTSQEELRSTNEEMQSTNEELQSTNEEITTSKEEMQSLNEELQTVNHELQTKVDELSHSANDMKNLLNSTDIATLFLDKDLNVRRFTPQATKIIKLIPGDVGRPITDLATGLCYPELMEDGRAVLETLVPAEKPIGCKDGRWFTVRIMPYRTLDDRIDGVVITFADITVATATASKLGVQHASLEKRFAKQTAGIKESQQNAPTPASAGQCKNKSARKSPAAGKNKGRSS